MIILELTESERDEIHSCIYLHAMQCEARVDRLRNKKRLSKVEVGVLGRLEKQSVYYKALAEKIKGDDTLMEKYLKITKKF